MCKPGRCDIGHIAMPLSIATVVVRIDHRQIGSMALTVSSEINRSGPPLR